jgi:hypothetical protein
MLRQVGLTRCPLALYLEPSYAVSQMLPIWPSKSLLRGRHEYVGDLSLITRMTTIHDISFITLDFVFVAADSQSLVPKVSAFELQYRARAPNVVA